jgi:Spy/CpxP family protein refolding chaperone
MNRKRSFLISIFVLVGMVIIGSIVFSGRYPGSHAERTERAIDWFSSRLELTEGQKAKLLSIHEELKNLEMALKKDRGQTKEEIIKMLGSNELDQDSILEIIEEKQKQVDYFAPKIIAGFADFHDSLTMEQRRELVDEIGSHNHLGGDHRHFRSR